MELLAPERELLEKLHAANIRIPPRPQILQDIEAMLNDENSTERMIGQLIGRDVRLTAEVFKLANSPFYRRARKIESLEQAVRMLGRNAMHDITRSAILRQTLGGGEQMESFWERCTDIGTICSVLCEQLGHPGDLTAEHAYLAGLFHDCGVPVLMQHIEGYAVDQFDSPNGPDFLAEDDANATSHCIAGLMVATEWQLPDMLCEAIRSHHYVIAEDQPAAQVIALLQLGMHAYICHHDWDDGEWDYHAPRVLPILGLDAARLDDVIREALASFDVFH